VNRIVVAAVVLICVRRMRWQDRQLPAHHVGLKLHGAALSSARRDPKRYMEISGGADP
jgi:hypothetical protein